MISLIISIILFKVFNLCPMIVDKILDEVKIILPLNKRDIDDLKQKQNELKKTKEVNLIRNCDPCTYLTYINNQYTQKTIFIVTISIIAVITNVATVFDYYFHIYDRENNLQIASSLSILIILYLLYSSLVDNIARKATLVILIATSSFLLFIIFFYYQNNISYSKKYEDSINTTSYINYNYTNMCSIYNNRISLILEKIPEELNHFIDNRIINNCSNTRFIMLFSVVFCVIVSILYIPIKENSYMEYSFCNLKENYISIELLYKGILNVKENNKIVHFKFINGYFYKNIKKLIKINSIINIIVFFLLVDAFVFNEIILYFHYYANKTMIELYFYSIVLILILVEFIISYKLIKFKSMPLLGTAYRYNQNYIILNNDSVVSAKMNIESNNNKFWSIFNSFYICSIIPILCCITFISKSEAIFYLFNTKDINQIMPTFNNNNSIIKKTIIESVFYTLLIGTYFSKGIVSQLYILYSINIRKKF